MTSFENVFRPASLVPGLTGLALAALVLWWQVGRRHREALPLPPQPIDRSDFLWAFGIAAAFAMAALVRLSEPNQAVFDECYHARTAMQTILGQAGMEWTHPPLAKLLMSVGLRLSGAVFDPREGVYLPAGPFDPRASAGWRAASVVFGALALLFQYALARSLTGRRGAAGAAAALLAVDGVFFVQSRTAMLNIFTVCFVLAATLCAWKVHRTDRLSWRLALGLALGAAVSTRWSALAALALLGIFVVVHDLSRVRTASRPFPETLKRIGGLLLAFVVVPAIVYGICYLPELRQAGIGTVGDARHWFVTRQHEMWEYHTRLAEGHPYASPWWSWPLLVRPVWYFYERATDGSIRGIFCIGNAPIWWGFAPALAASAVCAVRERATAPALVAGMGLGLWLVWGIQPRTLIFTHYLLEAIPFAAIALGTIGERMWRSERAVSPWIATGFVALAAVWALFYYPLWTALPLAPGAFGVRVWMGDPWV